MNDAVITPDFLKNRCKESYADFAELMQDDGWFDPVHRRLCDWIQYWVDEYEDNPKYENEDCKLLIVMPRGSLKTTIVTKYFPTWLTLRDPNNLTLIATNTIAQGRKKLEDIRGLFDSHDTFRALFPDILPKKKDRWTNEAAEVNRTKKYPEATFEAAGMKTKKTGSHYHCILEDDTTAPDPDEMKTETCTPSFETIERAIGWHKSSLPLLVPKGRRIRLIITTRWADEDLVDYVLKHEDYKIFDMPAISKDGRANFGKFYPLEKLKSIESDLGPYMFSCLYLNRPIDASRRTFQSTWFQRTGDIYDVLQNPLGGLHPCYVTLAVDPAISEKDEACETAITEVLHVKHPDNMYQVWTKDIHDHLNPFETVNKTLDRAEHWMNQGFAVKGIIVESNAYQASLKYYFWDAMTKRGINVPIISQKSRTNKNIRIEGMVPYFASKRIFLHTDLTPEVESQLKQFPHGKLVDIIDSFAMHGPVSLRIKRIKPPKPKDDVLLGSFEEVINEVRKNSAKREGKSGVLSDVNKGMDIDSGMSTGLGLSTDVSTLFFRSGVN